MEVPSREDVLEQRATVRLLHYWMSLPRTAKLPEISVFSPKRNPVSWDKCFLVAFGDVPDQQPAAIEHVGRDLWAMTECQIPQNLDFAALPPLVQRLIGDLAEALRTSQCVQHAGSHVIQSGKELQYRCILLPFADYEHRPRYGLGAVTMRLKDV